MSGHAALLTDIGSLRVVVAGAGTAGASAARFLADRGAHVVVVDDRAGAALAGLDVVPTAAVVGDGVLDADLLVVSPGFRPESGVVAAARASGVPVWGEVELAWHVDVSGLLGPPRTWIVVTGTNGKTTTTSMVEAVVERSPHTVAACGNIGLPVLDALVAEPRVDVLAAELSSFQLFWAPSVTPAAGVVLNIAEDHLDWHGSMDAYVAAKAGALRGPLAVVGGDDPVAGSMSATTPDGRTVRTRLGPPADGEVGVADGHIVDRAFGPGRTPRRVVPVAGLRPPGPPGVADATAAAALCLGIGIDPATVADGLSGFVPGRHRGEVVARWGDVVAVDDSKATNPHAAQASVAARRRVVLVGGGQLKGAAVDDLVLAVADRVAGAVLLGVDRDVIAAAITRHAPAIPTVTLFTGDDGRVNAMPVVSGADDTAVDRAQAAAAAASAHPADGSTTAADQVMAAAVAAAHALVGTSPEPVDAVLLAPAAASLDMFPGYGARGDAFAAGAIACGATAEVRA
ncbi:UDP-N-acetylmuramoyl-L-alanine--D-glutamate ligase [Williamsia serinedens]|uniref:UDP-N-acetylmuramoylalanine--D-glutamate ligase n=1 Tax=Williamsia serinedens TaxID=391736 RepID=A0ABT1H5V9_9NOCA|nr:UDP-N-acetylmuramoyl-L-alanine--D-glutamate ligase [Williamsia serinedens]MCP2162526.1 UDP-N-acetylmuramoylalanine--D-glutamate ligase [Williamsia serinedens]